MKRLYLLTIIGLLFCACHLNAQEVITMQQLEGTKWQMKEPNNKNVDTFFEFSDRYITCISDVHYPDTKFRKGLKHKYINKYLYYLADKASTSFDKNEVGQSPPRERISCKNLMVASSGSKFVNTPPPSWC